MLRSTENILAGTWQTYVVKDQDIWHKISKDSPIDYAATVIVNPLTALRMLEDFTTLNSGTPVDELFDSFQASITCSS